MRHSPATLPQCPIFVSFLPLSRSLLARGLYVCAALARLTDARRFARSGSRVTHFTCSLRAGSGLLFRPTQADAGFMTVFVPTRTDLRTNGY